VVTLPLSGDLDQARLHPIAPTKSAKDHTAIVALASSAPHTINAGTVGTFFTNFPCYTGTLAPSPCVARHPGNRSLHDKTK
jgi:hypothetical protein